MDELNEHVVKEGDSYYVKSKDRSKTLGGPYKTKAEADKRLGQIEFFKHNESFSEFTQRKNNVQIN